MRTLLCSSSIALALLAGPTLGQNAQPREITPREIVVTAEGQVSARPDMAVVFLGVMRQARTAQAAMSDTSAAMQRVLERLREAGIDDRDVQTTNLNLSPQYLHTNDGSPPRVTGYIASNDVSVRVRALDGLGKVLDTLVEDGANSMNGISFTVAEPEPLEIKARIDAVANAMAKAKTLAEAAGVTLGDVRRIVEGGEINIPSPAMRGMAMAEAAVPIASGEIDIRQTVTIVFEIAD